MTAKRHRGAARCNSVTVDPTGRYAYAANINDNTGSQYTILAGGALIPMTPTTVAGGGREPPIVAELAAGTASRIVDFGARASS